MGLRLPPLPRFDQVLQHDLLLMLEHKDFNDLVLQVGGGDMLSGYEEEHSLRPRMHGRPSLDPLFDSHVSTLPRLPS